MNYVVKSECVDVRSGKRFYPGESFEPAPDPEQAVRLMGAGAIEEAREEGVKRIFLALAFDADGTGLQMVDTVGFHFGGVAVAETAPTDPDDFHWQPLAQPVDDLVDDNGDGLDARDMTVAKLQDIAATETVDLTDVTLKADIIAAIRAKRAVASGAGA